MSSLALMTMFAPDVTVAPSPMYARVFRSKMSTTAEAPTAASPVPAPPAMATPVTDGPSLMIGRMI